ncbi:MULTISPECIES: hypothetical protein [Nostoc]|uniref:Uncharacterized protein n=1 Tax=Nostoc commune NIES-4072 TaxID=2005467 RepID=A0A2R5FYR5_NOSCO|nr:hypothetical protein [Nostoc commune]BBD70761.1 hypothetical protein NIES4070_71720 [Nostoc commune HK-02]GBG23415.1 hypothetical protein NIES4072_71270 [Nostoc commune NIES-4072]
MKHLLEISKSEFNFSLLQRDDTLIEAQIIIPFAHEELSKTIISLSQKYWQQQIDDYRFSFKRANNEDAQINEILQKIEFSQTTDFIYILAKPDYIMGTSQVRALQHTLSSSKLLTPEDYISINRFLIPYEKLLTHSINSENTKLGFYYSLSPK